MKLYFPQVAAVVSCLEAILVEGRYADRVIQQVLKEDKRRGSQDRAFIAESVYEIVRWWRLLQEALPPQHTLWHVFGAWWVWRGNALPPFRELDGLPKDLEERLQKTQAIRKIRESIPDWLDALGEAELGEKWEEELHALNQPAEVVLRANTLKASVSEIRKSLTVEGIATKATPFAPEALLLEKRQNVFTSKSFQNGLFEVQDAASQQVALACGVEPGMRVVDACAGGGGKSLHLAALMENKGRILSMDVEGWKLEELKKRAKRAGAHIIETRVIEGSKTIKRLKGSADVVLLDVPCSGLGVLRRNPDAKWKLQPEQITELRQTQAQILQQYSAVCKTGGTLVYATCSLLPSEGEAQVARFLQENPEFSLQQESRFSPAHHGFDGFYLAVLKHKTP